MRSSACLQRLNTASVSVCRVSGQDVAEWALHWLLFKLILGKLSLAATALLWLGGRINEVIT